MLVGSGLRQGRVTSIGQMLAHYIPLSNQWVWQRTLQNAARGRGHLYDLIGRAPSRGSSVALVTTLTDDADKIKALEALQVSVEATAKDATLICS